MNKDVIDKTKLVVDYITESDNYKKYLSAKEKMEDNIDIKKLVDEVKRLQKMIVNHPKEKDSLEKELDDKINQLKEIPLYNEFLNLQEELNMNINYIKSTLNDYFNNILN